MTKLKLTAEPGQHGMTMTRDFDAPRDLVFKAYTDPELIPQWWGYGGRDDHRRRYGRTEGWHVALHTP